MGTQIGNALGNLFQSLIDNLILFLMGLSALLGGCSQIQSDWDHETKKLKLSYELTLPQFDNADPANSGIVHDGNN